MASAVNLCNNQDIAVIAVQEHGLTPNNLHLLNNIHPEFIGYGVSAMHDKLSCEIYSRRPFGGVTFLWRRSLSNYINIIDCYDSGCCLAIILNFNIVIKLVNIYFPCYSYNIHYTVELGNSWGKFIITTR